MTQTEEHSHPWYLGVFIWLFVLTVIEVGVARIDLGRYVLLSLLGILAFAKAGLVAMYFMHLKFERTRLVLFVLTPLACVLLMLSVLYVDALRIVPW